MKSSPGFKGKYFCYSGDHVAYGKIVDQFDGVLLLQLQSQSDPVCKGNMIATPIDVVLETFENEYFAQWLFFQTQKQLDTYLAWMDTFHEEKPKVVSLVKKATP
jgi:hypothetical protein